MLVSLTEAVQTLQSGNVLPSAGVWNLQGRERPASVCRGAPAPALPLLVVTEPKLQPPETTFSTD